MTAFRGRLPRLIGCNEALRYIMQGSVVSSFAMYPYQRATYQICALVPTCLTILSIVYSTVSVSCSVSSTLPVFV